MQDMEGEGENNIKDGKDEMRGTPRKENHGFGKSYIWQSKCKRNSNDWNIYYHKHYLPCKFWYYSAF